MKTKKTAILITLIGLFLFILAGCGNESAPVTGGSSADTGLYKPPVEELTGRLVDATGDLGMVTQPTSEPETEKKDVKKADLTLKAVTVNGESVDITAQEWQITVKNKVKTAAVEAKTNSKDATVSEGIGDHKLKIGDNSIQIKVRSGNEEAVYTLNVVRKKKKATPQVTAPEPQTEANAKPADSSAPNTGKPAQHIHNYATSVVPATCVSNGYTVHTCSCGASYTDGYTPKTGHSFASSVVLPSGGKQGYTQYICQVCGYSYIEFY